MFQKYVLKKPAPRNARIGAFYAALPPVIIGMILLMGISGQNFDGNKAFNLPIAISMVFGAPIVAWFSQKTVTRKQQTDYWGIVEPALIWATVIQVFFGIVYLLYYTATTQDMVVFTNLVATCLTVHTILWLTMTLPLTLICAMIFRHSAMRQVYG